MPVPLGLKTAFSKASTIEPIYTGGPAALTSDARYVFTFLEQVTLTQVESGRRVCSFGGDTSQITAIAVSPASNFLATFGDSFLLSIYELPNDLGALRESPEPTRKISRAHEAPVHIATVDPSSSYLASGSADGIVKVWDLRRGFATHSFKGHAGVISSIIFHLPSVSNSKHLHVITASVDSRIHIYQMAPGSANSRPLYVLEGHTSVPRGLAVTKDSKWLFSGGRDGVVLKWNYLNLLAKGQKSNTSRSPTTIPVFERVEALGVLSDSADNEELRFYIGGERGSISIWDAHSGKKITTLGAYDYSQERSEEQNQIVEIIYTKAADLLVSIHADHNILFYSASSLKQLRCTIGYNDEIIDSALLSPRERDTHLALATNSSVIRLYSICDLNCRLLSGHSDIVLCLKSSACGRIFGSGSKDNTARLWKSLDDNMLWSTVAECEGHTESVGSVAFPNLPKVSKELLFMFTGSQDRTIKMWDASPLLEGGVHSVKLKTLTTVKAHDKDINSLDVSPDDSLLASGSQDKTIKIFRISHLKSKNTVSGELKVSGTLKGHKRGVWDVKFHPSERLLASAGGDKTIRLWNIADFTCVKTLEEHTNSVLRVEFLSGGAQLVSSASDGLLKVWNLNEERCVTTLDNHEDKVWALSVTSDEKKIVSGAGDSIVTIWKDVTDEMAVEREKERTALVLKKVLLHMAEEQTYNNYVAVNDYRNAFTLALSMDQPGRLLKLFRSLISTADINDNESISGNARVDETIATLSQEDLVKLLRHVRTWNASSKTSEVAQKVLYSILKLRHHSDIGALTDGGNADEVLELSCNKTRGGLRLHDLIESLIPYTERHLHRLDRLLQESYVIDLVIGEMDDGLIDIGQDDIFV